MTVGKRYVFAMLVLTVVMTAACTYAWEHGLEGPISRVLDLPYDEDFEEAERWRFILTACGFSVLSLLLPGALLLRMVGRLSQAYRRLLVSERQAQELAQHDPLTGLFNRRIFHEGLGDAIRTCNVNARPFALLLIDLDHFKAVNDTFGHTAGDAVLCEISRRLRHKANARDGLAARLGGDEFAMLIPMPNGPAAIGPIIERLSSRLAQPLDWQGRMIALSASIGIALAPADGASADDLLNAADMALYRAKQDRRGTDHFFEVGADANRLQRREREQELRSGITRGEIRPYYQPLIRFADDQVCGFEILARWHHPSLGVLGPAEFIPMAEDLGIITELTESLLRQACADITAMPGSLRYAFNVSPSQLTEPGLASRLISIMRSSGIDLRRFEVEVTESAMMEDNEQAKGAIAAFRMCGMTVALDDFGTGYSSLSNLRLVKFDKVKIDRSFVQTMLTSEESRKLVEAVIALAFSFGMKVTAEGIESREVADLIVEKGCNQGQGFFFSRPVPFEEAVDFVLQETRTAA